MSKVTESEVSKMSFPKIYQCYLDKVQRKGKTKEELDEIITWLTGYSADQIEEQSKGAVSFGTFIAQMPELNQNVGKIKGLICGWRVEDMEEGFMKKVRYLDKLVDELARGKKMESILRQ